MAGACLVDGSILFIEGLPLITAGHSPQSPRDTSPGHARSHSGAQDSWTTRPLPGVLTPLLNRPLVSWAVGIVEYVFNRIHHFPYLRKSIKVSICADERTYELLCNKQIAPKCF